MKQGRRTSGFSLVEVLVALPAVIVVLWGVTSLTTDMVARNGLSRNEILLRQNFISTMNYMLAEIQSAAFLSPTERLTESAGVYFGLSGIDTSLEGLATPSCQNDKDAQGEKHSIFRYTSLSRHYAVERLLRSWNEKNIPGDATNRLRLTYHPNPASTQLQFPFQPDGDNVVALVPEIYLIDEDLAAFRRYRPVSAAHVSTDKDPYDDLAKFDTAGNPITFVYTEVTLAMPTDYPGNAQSTADLNFITGSMAYVSNTKRICVSPENKLIEFDEGTGKSRELLDPSAYGFRFDRFEVTYYGSKTTSDIDRSAFMAYPTDLVQQRCVNLLNFHLEFSHPSHNGSQPTSLVMDRMALIRNFNPRRSAICP